jgi:hypothetical protein
MLAVRIDIGTAVSRKNRELQAKYAEAQYPKAPSIHGLPCVRMDAVAYGVW